MSARLERVMLVDDNEADNYLARLVIEESGLAATVIGFPRPELALEHLRERDRPPVSMILLDVRMPTMDGFEFLDAYRELDDDQRAYVVIVMLTTSLNPADRERARLYGLVEGYQEKPLTVEAFAALVEQHFPGS